MPTVAVEALEARAPVMVAAGLVQVGLAETVQPLLPEPQAQTAVVLAAIQKALTLQASLTGVAAEAAALALALLRLLETLSLVAVVGLIPRPALGRASTAVLAETEHHRLVLSTVAQGSSPVAAVEAEVTPRLLAGPVAMAKSV